MAEKNSPKGKRPKKTKRKKGKDSKKKAVYVLKQMKEKARELEKKGLDVGGVYAILTEAREALDKEDIKRSKSIATKGKKALMAKIREWKRIKGGKKGEDRKETGEGLEKGKRDGAGEKKPGLKERDMAGEKKEPGGREEAQIKERDVAKKKPKGDRLEKKEKRKKKKRTEKEGTDEEMEGGGEAGGAEEAIPVISPVAISEEKEKSAADKGIIEEDQKKRNIAEAKKKEKGEAKKKEKAEKKEREEAAAILKEVRERIGEVREQFSVVEESKLCDNAGVLLKRGDLRAVKKECQKAKEKIEEKAERFRERKEKAKTAIIEVQQYLARLEDRGVELGETWDIYGQLASDYRNDDLDKITDTAEEIKRSTALWREYDDSLLSILGIRKKLARLKKEGADISELEGKLQKTRELLYNKEYSEVRGEVKDLSKSAADLLEDVKAQRAEQELEHFASIIEKAKETRDVESAETVLKEAREALKAEEWERSVEKVRSAKKDLYPTYCEMLTSELKELLADADETGVKTVTYKDNLVRSQELFGSEDYENAVDILENTRENILEAISYRECVEDIRKMKNRLAELAQEGYDIEAAHNIMLPARNDLEAGNYRKVSDILERTGEKAEEIVKHSELNGIIAEARGTLDELGDVGMEVGPLEEELTEIGERDIGEDVAYERSLARARELAKEMSDLQDAYPAVIDHIKRSQYYISKMAEYGGDTEAMDSRFNGLTEAFEERDLDKARKLGEDCAAFSEERMEQFVRARSLLDNLEKIIERARKMGGDPTDVEAMKEDARDALERNDYGISLKITTEAVEKATGLKNRLHAVLGLKQMVQSRLNMADNLGINIESLELKFKQTDERLRNNELEAAENSLEEIQDEVESLTRKYSETAERIRAAQDIIFTLKKRGAFMPKAEELFEDIVPLLDANEFDKAGETAKEALREGRKIEKEYDELAQTIDRAQRKMSIAKDKGAVIRPVIPLFREVGELMDDGEYADALEKVEDVKVSLNEILDLHAEASRLLKVTWERLSEAKALGMDPGDVEELVGKAHETFKEGEYRTSIDHSKETATSLLKILSGV